MNKKIITIDELINLVQNLYDKEEIEWKPYCKIRNGLIDLKKLSLDTTKPIGNKKE